MGFSVEFILYLGCNGYDWTATLHAARSAKKSNKRRDM